MDAPEQGRYRLFLCRGLMVWPKTMVYWPDPLSDLIRVKSGKRKRSVGPLV